MDEQKTIRAIQRLGLKAIEKDYADIAHDEGQAKLGELVSRYSLSQVHEHGGALHLLVADEDQNLIVLKQLLNSRAIPIDAQNKQGATALHVAVGRQWREAVEALVVAGARTDIRNDPGNTPLDLCEVPEIAEILERAGG